MMGSLFDTITREAAAGVSRRTSLTALGGAALAAIGANPAISAAKKNSNKKGKKKTQNQANKKCKQQVGQCRDVVTQRCATNDPDGSDGCLTQYLECCDLFANCNAAAALNCLSA